MNEFIFSFERKCNAFLNHVMYTILSGFLSLQFFKKIFEDFKGRKKMQINIDYSPPCPEVVNPKTNFGISILS